MQVKRLTEHTDHSEISANQDPPSNSKIHQLYRTTFLILIDHSDLNTSKTTNKT